MGLAPNIELGDRYRLLRLIGRGGQSEVWLAERLATGQLVAVKALIRAKVDDPTVTERFVREAQTISRLRHPNTVRLYDFGTDPSGYLFMVLEYIEGETLEAWLRALARQGRVPTQAQVIDVGSQVLRAVAEAHALGIIHRDIKPANVMLQHVDGEAPTARVVDFGIARIAHSTLTGPGRAIGTPAYMSPEQCVGRAIDGRTDLYSVGLVLYRCVAGQPPFDGSPVGTVARHLSEPPPALATATKTMLSPPFVEVVHRALAKAPDDRFASATEMRRALEAAATAPLTVGEPHSGVLPSVADGGSGAQSGASFDLSTEFDASSPRSRR
ncbi:MAG: serine/threonine protein kinase [Deltaproteobacteria bacterium]|nr:serine/threonine protein kinase [Deltaproteobacteria bacterium]